MKVRVFLSGGTIDDLEYEAEENAPKDQESIVPRLLSKSRISIEYNIEQICFKDSRFVNNEDREKLVKRCKECDEEKIIITHGTMTMPITAKYLGQKKLPKTIVILGSAIPGNKEGSDALFNLGTAFASVQLLPHGVYITMNGKIFSWDNVKKNLKTGYFQKEESKTFR